MKQGYAGCNLLDYGCVGIHNKHKGDVMRDKWELHNDGGIRICIALGDGRCKQVAEAEIIGWTREEAVRHAEQIVNDHNQHAALVEQRDRLAAALRECVRLIEHDSELVRELAKPAVLRTAKDALAAVEQGEGDCRLRERARIKNFP